MRALCVCIFLACASAAFAAFNPPNWTQCDPQWGNIPIGNKSTTICQHGNAETCYAMLMSTRGYKGNPGDLVLWLNANEGYKCYFLKGCVLQQRKIDELGFTKFYQTIDFPTHETIMNYFNSGYGVLAQVYSCKTLRYVLITGSNGSKGYTVHDPSCCTDTITHINVNQWWIIE